MALWKIIRSFGYGGRGLLHTIQSEQNMRIHGLAAIVVTTAGWYFKIGLVQWIAIVLCMGSVIALECVNTAVERLADRISTEPDPLIKQAKDTAAAAVLVAALTSVAVACLVFIPKVWIFFGSGG